MADKKKRDALAGVNMAMSLDSQSARDLAQLMKRAKKPKIARVSKKEFNIRKPGAFAIQRNDIMKARFGGKVIQKMQDGGAKLSQAEMEAAIRAIEEQGNVFGKGESLSKDQTKKISDKFEADFAKMFGKRFGGAIKKMRKGGLMEAIKKVQAKGMELGGDVPMPKSKPKSLKADKTESLDKNFSKNVAKTNEKNKKLIGNQKKLDKNKDGKISGEDFKMMAKGGKVEEYGGGGSVKGGKMGCRGMGAALRGGGYTIS